MQEVVFELDAAVLDGGVTVPEVSRSFRDREGRPSGLTVKIDAARVSVGGKDLPQEIFLEHVLELAVAAIEAAGARAITWAPTGVRHEAGAFVAAFRERRHYDCCVAQRAHRLTVNADEWMIETIGLAALDLPELEWWFKGAHIAAEVREQIEDLSYDVLEGHGIGLAGTYVEGTRFDIERKGERYTLKAKRGALKAAGRNKWEPVTEIAAGGADVPVDPKLRAAVADLVGAELLERMPRVDLELLGQILSFGRNDIDERDALFSDWWPTLRGPEREKIGRALGVDDEWIGPAAPAKAKKPRRAATVSRGTTIVMPAPRTRRDGAHCVLANGMVLVAGGDDGDSNHEDFVDIFDPATLRWSAGPPLPDGRSSTSLAALPDGGALLVAGTLGRGVSGPSWSTSVLRLVPDRSAWREAAPLPHPGRGHGVCVLADGSVFVCGGQGPKADRPSDWEYMTRAWRYLPDEDRWVELPRLPLGDHGTRASARPDGRVLVRNNLGVYVLAPGAERWHPADEDLEITPVAPVTTTYKLDTCLVVAGGLFFHGSPSRPWCELLPL